MPRGKVPSLLSANNGGITFDNSKIKSSCGRCKRSLPGGTRIGLFKTQQAGFTKQKRLCLDCVIEIVDRTQVDLDAIRAQVPK
jgi:hypothetical protein